MRAGSGYGRSREGAWIEITLAGHWSAKQNGRSREGAWIEIVLQSASAKELKRRSREGAWIEMPRVWEQLPS